MKEEVGTLSQELFHMNTEREFWFIKVRRVCKAIPSAEEIDNEGQPDDTYYRSKFLSMVTEYRR